MYDRVVSEPRLTHRWPLAEAPPDLAAMARELTARYGELKVDDNAVPYFANPATAASQARDSVVGVNWYLNRFVKITGQFENITFRGGAPNGGDRPTERGFYTRLQFAF